MESFKEKTFICISSMTCLCLQNANELYKGGNNHRSIVLREMLKSFKN